MPMKDTRAGQSLIHNPSCLVALRIPSQNIKLDYRRCNMASRTEAALRSSCRETPFAAIWNRPEADQFDCGVRAIKASNV
jgi:hypothetical protein